ncbi:MAG: FHA domain-containing protein [Planctomycetota bacterium]|nr:MAG: FHA domain-containing protein [Planctomycetota bacterium]
MNLSEEKVFQRGIKIPRLVSLEGKAKGYSFYFWGKDSFEIGSSKDADFFLKDDSIAKIHAKVEIQEDSVIIMDFSQGRTYINGCPVDVQALEENDHVRLGKNVFVFNYRIVEEKNFVHILEDMERFQGWLHSPLPLPQDSPYLEIISGMGEGTIFPLKNREFITIGRNSVNDIKILDTKISRVHCRIFQKDGEYWIEDMGSTNGTFLQGEEVENAQKLENRNHIRIGFTVLCFHLP